MYSWEKSRRGDKSQANPSFSSTLLDEIYRSIDAGGVKRDVVKIPRERFASRDERNEGAVTMKAKKGSGVKEDESESRRRAYRVEKWMESKVHHDKMSTRRRQSLPDYDRMFFPTSWSSSDSSSGGETESPAMYRPRNYCFTEPQLVPISGQSLKTPKSSKQTSNKSYPFDSTNKNSEPKPKLSALKMYADLKKAKQPISPGIRLTSFLNSLFSHGNTKKTSKPATNTTHLRLINKPSSANPPKEKKPIKSNNPATVTVDEDDACSDTSSDLFELDHLTIMGSFDRRDYKEEELPVYETTEIGSKHGRRIQF